MMEYETQSAYLTDRAIRFKILDNPQMATDIVTQ